MARVVGEATPELRLRMAIGSIGAADSTRLLQNDADPELEHLVKRARDRVAVFAPLAPV
ncbi:MAG: hypothetical protein ACREMG_06535 [Gemmatimonadales bacterium]